MKIRGSLTITKGLTLPSPGGLTPLAGRVALSDATGKVLWGNLAMPTLDLGAVYSKKGTLVIYQNKVFYSLVDNASGNAYQDTLKWRELTAAGDGVLTEDQINALNGANNPSSSNPFMTLADIKNITILGTDTLANILANATGELNQIWITSTTGTDSFGTEVVVGDGLISTGVGYQWKTVGQMRGTPGPAGPIGSGVDIKGSTTVSNILPRNPLPAGKMWVATDAGIDDFGTAIKPGDGIVSDGTSWYNIGPFRGPAGIPGYSGTYIIKGSVTWLYNYTYFVRADIYVINGQLYSAAPVTITLSTAHPTLDRRDVFVADTNGTIFVQEGIPGIPAIVPGINTSILAAIANVDVIRDTIAPPIAVSNTVYNENLGVVGGEWDTVVTTSNGASIELENTTETPASGVKCIRVSNARNEIITFTNDTPITFGTDFSGFMMKAKSLSDANTCNITIRLVNNGIQVSDALDISEFGFDYTNTTDWQLITMSSVNFAIIATTFDSIHITFEDPSYLGISNILFDSISYQYGVSYIPEPYTLEYTSQLINNGDGSSPFITLADLPSTLNLDFQSVTDNGEVTDNNITTQAQRSSGSRAVNTIKVEIGDYDNLGGKTKVVIDDSTRTITMTGEVGFQNSTSDFIATVRTTLLTENRILNAPDKVGTLAIDGDYVDLISGQLIEGIKTFVDAPILNAGITFNNGVGDVFLVPGILAGQTLTLPEGSGTLALRSDTDTFIFSQPLPEGTWVIVHNKNKYPAVTVTNLARESVESTVAYPDLNTVVVTVYPIIAGFAFIN